VTAEVETRRRDARQELDGIAARLWKRPRLVVRGGESRDQLIVRRQANLLGDVHASEDLERIRTLFADLETKTDVIELLHRAETGEGVKISSAPRTSCFLALRIVDDRGAAQGGRPPYRRRAGRHRPDPTQLWPHRADGRICGHVLGELRRPR